MRACSCFRVHQTASHTRKRATHSQRHVLSAILTKPLMQLGDALLQRACMQGGKTDIMCLMASCPCEFSPVSTHDIHVTQSARAFVRAAACVHMRRCTSVVLCQTVHTPKSGFNRKRREHFHLCWPTPQTSHSPKPFLESTLFLSSRGSLP